MVKGEVMNECLYMYYLLYEVFIPLVQDKFFPRGTIKNNLIQGSATFLIMSAI